MNAFLLFTIIIALKKKGNLNHNFKENAVIFDSSCFKLKAADMQQQHAHCSALTCGLHAWKCTAKHTPESVFGIEHCFGIVH